MAVEFPKFWKDIEVELDEDPFDLLPVKSVLTALGFNTKTSIAGIKNAKNISNLEKDFMTMLNTSSVESFPVLKDIKAFSPGMKSMLLVVVNHLNLITKTKSVDDAGTVVQKMFDQAKKFCDSITSDKITVEDSGSGLICKVSCPECNVVTAISSSVNRKNGTSSFSIYNFQRHYEKHGKNLNESTSSTMNIVCENCETKDTEIGSVKVELTEALAKINALTLERDQLKIVCDEMAKELKKNEANIEQVNEELSEARAAMSALVTERESLNVKNAQFEIVEATLKNGLERMRSERMENVVFTTNLCCFEKIITEDILIENNSVKYSDCQNRDVWLHFEKIFEGASHEEKFDGIQPYLDAFIGGKMACVINHGTTGSGKTSTMFGFDGTKGILESSFDYLMSKSQDNIINITAIELIGDKMFDIGEKKIQIDKLIDANQKLIRSHDDSKSFLLHLSLVRSQKATDQNKTSSRSHLIIEITTSQNPNTKMAFIDLAGFESPNMKSDLPETKFINKTLSEINGVLSKVAHKEIVTFSSATKYLKPYLTNGAQALLLYHISNDAVKKGLEYMKDVVPSTKKAPKRPGPKMDHRAPLNNITNRQNC